MREKNTAILIGEAIPITILNDILDVSGTENGHPALNITSFDLYRTLDSNLFN